MSVPPSFWQLQRMFYLLRCKTCTSRRTWIRSHIAGRARSARRPAGPVLPDLLALDALDARHLLQLSDDGDELLGPLNLQRRRDDGPVLVAPRDGADAQHVDLHAPNAPRHIPHHSAALPPPAPVL